MTPLEDGSTDEHQPASADADAAGAAVVPLSIVPDPAEESATAEGAAEQPEGEEPRRYPSTIGGALYLLVLAMTILALVVVAVGHWRGGVHILAGSIIAAAVPRAVLPRRDAGMLGVRGRWFDVALMVAVGAAMWFLASTIPAQG